MPRTSSIDRRRPSATRAPAKPTERKAIKRKAIKRKAIKRKVISKPKKPKKPRKARAVAEVARVEKTPRKRAKANGAALKPRTVVMHTSPFWRAPLIPPSLGEQVAMVFEALRHKAPTSRVAVVAREIDAFRPVITGAFRLSPYAVDLVQDIGAVPDGTDVVMVAHAVEAPISLIPVFTRAPVLIGVMLGDPVFSELRRTGTVENLAVAHAFDGSSWTVFTLSPRARAFAPRPSPQIAPSFTDTPPSSPPASISVPPASPGVQSLQPFMRPNRPKVALVVDRSGWCAHRTALQLKRLLNFDFDFRIETIGEAASRPSVDVDVLVCFSRHDFDKVRETTRAGAIVLGMFEDFTLDEAHTAPGEAAEDGADLVVVACDRFRDRLKEVWPAYGTAPVFVTEAGVDSGAFDTHPMPPNFTVGWCGSTQTGPEDHKGLNIVREACRAANVPLIICNAADDTGRQHERMGEWYAGITVLICASRSEGAPNPMLEAAACGRPTISTDVGLARRFITHGVSGYVVDDVGGHESTSGQIADLLWRMQHQWAEDPTPLGPLAQMGRAARRAAEGSDWSIKVGTWKSALSAASDVAEQKRRRSTAHIEPVAPTLDERIESVVISAYDGQPESLTLVEGGHEKPHFLLTRDVPGWAFDVNLLDMEEYLGDRFAFDRWYVNPSGLPSGMENELPRQWRYDGVYVAYHRWRQLHALDWVKAYGCLRSRWFWTEDRKKPGPVEWDLVNRFRAFHTVTRDVYDELAAHCPRVVWLTNPVNTRRFTPTPIEGEVIPSWNGNARHSAGAADAVPTRVEDDVKGFHTIVTPAVEALRGEGLIHRMPIAEYSTARKRPDEMPAFYQGANLTICTSAFEGSSNSICEAMSAGHAIISTRVGDMMEMTSNQQHHYGETGIFFLEERTPEALAQALRELIADPARVKAMGAVNRAEIEARWSWAVWADRYADFLRM